MRILFLDSNHPFLHKKLEKEGHSCDLFYDLSEFEIKQILHRYDGIVLRSKIKITKEIIELAVTLKFIARAGAGLENIDVEYANSKNITCVSAPEGNRTAVGEHAVAMLLSLLNNLNKADNEVRNGKWVREENRGVELKNKTIGIIGYGNMGSAFAEVLKGFGVNILVYDKYKKNFGNDFIVESEMRDLFLKANIISLHTPLTNETNYLIDDEFINKFKNKIHVINTSRGKCLNTEDLVKNIKSGKILGACLDVLEYEMTSFENLDITKLPYAFQYLIKSNRVILSPHIAGWTKESNKKIAEILSEKILKLAKS